MEKICLKLLWTAKHENLCVSSCDSSTVLYFSRISNAKSSRFCWMLDGIKQLHRYPGVPRWWDFSRRKHNGMSNPAEMRAFNTLFNDSVLYSIKYTFNTRLKEDRLYHWNGPHVNSTKTLILLWDFLLLFETFSQEGSGILYWWELREFIELNAFLLH